MANPKKPTRLKLVTGTARPGRLNPDEPQPEIKMPSCPSELSPGAKTEWLRIAPLLESQGLLSEFDRAALAGYCELYSRWTKALLEIQNGGEVVETPNGSLQVSPWLSIARSAEKELRMFSSEFGMTPASRSKVNATPKKSDKPEGKERFFK